MLPFFVNEERPLSAYFKGLYPASGFNVPSVISLNRDRASSGKVSNLLVVEKYEECLF